MKKLEILSEKYRVPWMIEGFKSKRRRTERINERDSGKRARDLAGNGFPMDQEY